MSPRLPGQIKTVPEDFCVWEIPANAPAGEGDHRMLWIEKRGLSTPHLLTEIARRTGLRSRDLGIAGRKDKWALTQQWVSLPLQLGANESGLPSDGESVTVAEGWFRILNRDLHPRSLKTGQLRGNRFAIVVRGLDAEQEQLLMARVEAVIAEGRMLNPFGEQRFLDPEALAQAAALLRRGRMSGRKDRFLLSIAQAAVFNRYMTLRDAAEVVDGEWYGTAGGGRFDGAREEQPALLERLRSGEIVPLGPMPGRDVQPVGTCHDLLDQAQRELGLEGSDWSAFGKKLRGTWRPLWVPLNDLTAEPTDDGPRLSFSLPSGSYATVLLERLLEGSWVIPSNS